MLPTKSMLISLHQKAVIRRFPLNSVVFQYASSLYLQARDVGGSTSMIWTFKYTCQRTRFTYFSFVNKKCYNSASKRSFWFIQKNHNILIADLAHFELIGRSLTLQFWNVIFAPPHRCLRLNARITCHCHLKRYQSAQNIIKNDMCVDSHCNNLKPLTRWCRRFLTRRTACTTEWAV